MRVALIGVIAALCACAQISRIVRDPAPRPKAVAGFSEKIATLDGEGAKEFAAKYDLTEREIRLGLFEGMAVLDENGYVLSAKLAADLFPQPKEALVAFVQTEFDRLVKTRKCAYAADLVHFFELGERYADAAIGCFSPEMDPIELAAAACQRPGSKKKMREVVSKAVAAFGALSAQERNYGTASVVLTLCAIEPQEAYGLYRLSLEDDELPFAMRAIEHGEVVGWTWPYAEMRREVYAAALAEPDLFTAEALLGDEKFEASDADRRGFVEAAVGAYECARALRIAVASKFDDALTHGILSHRKCLGQRFDDAVWSIPEPRSREFFEAGVKAEKFLFASELAQRDGFTDDDRRRVEAEAIKAKAFDELMDLPDRPSRDATDERRRKLELVLQDDEEWFVVRYAIGLRGGYDADLAEADAWIERAFLHALFRGAWQLAADCAAEHSDVAFRDKAARLAFDGAMKAENDEEAYFIARQRKLGDEAQKEVALLKYRKMRAEERTKAKAKAKKKKPSGDWEVSPDR